MVKEHKDLLMEMFMLDNTLKVEEVVQNKQSFIKMVKSILVLFVTMFEMEKVF
jgi:hypothetical protein